ncbi:hypothetical protein [Actinomadura rayongensis]|uniref:Uncharacterized protein n=1 Tax=Actinomadura rayongensis TaxID=1429076 RepID=A0A6I4W609_9ACTN|nr:hypothetical protein [Actinomadura rayongensis]MXQ64911.1 hypothetical protein [Actinomadura rayongensis]
MLMAAPETDPDPRFDTTLRVAPGDGDTLHLTVRGELDLATWAPFRHLLVSVAELWPRVVIDASGLTGKDTGRSDKSAVFRKGRSDSGPPAERQVIRPSVDRVSNSMLAGASGRANTTSTSPGSSARN